MSVDPAEPNSPEKNTGENDDPQDILVSSIPVFILVVVPLFLVISIILVVLAFAGGSGDSWLRAAVIVTGLLSIGVAVALPVYSISMIVRSRRRELRLEKSLKSAADGDLACRLEPISTDGEDTLAESFNCMMVSMQDNLALIRSERSRFRSIHQGISDGIIVFDTRGHVVSANPAAEAAIGLLEKQIRGTGHIGISEVEHCVNAPDIVPDASKVKCWIEKKCECRDCPSYESDDLRCWLQCGTYCHNEIQGTFNQKRDACERCDVYQKNGIRNVGYERAGSDYSVTISPILDDFGSEEGRIAVFHDITAVVAAGESLKRNNLELSVLNEVGTSLSESFDDIENVLEEALANMAYAVGANAGAILLRQEGGGALHLAAHMGISPQASVFMRLLDLSERLDGFLDQGTGLIDVDKFFRRFRSAQLMLTREGFKKPVMMPISARGGLIGVLILMDTAKEEYKEADIRMLKSLAAQIGVAAQNQDYFHDIARAKNTWETTFDSMTDGVSFHDMNFKIVHTNRAMAEMLGTTKGELVGSTCYKTIHHSNMPLAQCPQKEVVKTGKTLSFETEDPILKKYFRLSVNPVFDSGGSVVGIVHVMRDITERKLLREQLLQSEKMAAVGQLVSGVAHELNNPLTGVIGYSQLMLRKCEENQGNTSPDDIRSILNEAQRASKIVQNLLAFSRKYKPQKSLVDINQAIRAVLDLRVYEMTLNNIRIETDFDAGLPHAMADLHQMEQVFLNLLNNAMQAVVDSGHAGIISVSTRSDGDKVLMSVTDNGDGIATEDQGRIFDPFFTTREVGRGPGLGLSICYGIIEEHGGNIRVASSKGNGTTLTVELPAATRTSVGTSAIDMKKAVADMKGSADHAG